MILIEQAESHLSHGRTELALGELRRAVVVAHSHRTVTVDGLLLTAAVRVRLAQLELLLDRTTDALRTTRIVAASVDRVLRTAPPESPVLGAACELMLSVAALGDELDDAALQRAAAELAWRASGRLHREVPDDRAAARLVLAATGAKAMAMDRDQRVGAIELMDGQRALADAVASVAAAEPPSLPDSLAVAAFLARRASLLAASGAAGAARRDFDQAIDVLRPVAADPAVAERIAALELLRGLTDGAR